MKTLITMMICFLLSMGTVMAQNNKTYTGLVIDQNGNPVVGAEVMAPGGGASTITDSDGSFSIEVPIMLKKLTASYTGMREKSLKLGNSSNLIFKMRGLKKMVGFISVFGNIGVSLDHYTWRDFYDEFSGSENYNQITLGGGIMGGQMGELANWGWYVKGTGYVGVDYCEGTGTLTLGAIRKLSSKAHLYFGGGAAYVYEAMGFSLDLGAIFRVSDHINIITGLNYTNSTDKSTFEYYEYEEKDKYNMINFNIGVGYIF